MSGGVDSAVAAALLARAGHEVIGVTFRIGSGSGAEGRGCCSARQACDAAACAEALGLEHFVHHAEAEFHAAVVGPFAEAYLRGETPNPCIECNRAVRFPTMLRLADALGADAIATGHYARVEHDDASGRWCIARGADPTKDQSYVLYALGQETLARLLLPLGGIPKARTRELARELGLTVADKPDSQDICFVPDGDYRAYLLGAGLAGTEPGPIVDPTGNVLGRHEGTYRYTVGQRRGLGIGGGEPLYVLAVDPATATVTVGPAEELLAAGLRLANVVWGGAYPAALGGPLPVRVQMRAHGEAVEAMADLGASGGLTVTFTTPHRATAPGQSAVCYDAETGTRVLCGGIVTGVLG